MKRGTKSEDILHPDDAVPVNPIQIHGPPAPEPVVEAEVPQVSPPARPGPPAVVRIDPARVIALPRVATLTNMKGHAVEEVIVHSLSSTGGSAFAVIEKVDGSIKSIGAGQIRF